MRIEVLVGNEDPVVYPLNASKISLGTSENCEITLNAEGISRKHITILTEGDNFFVIDQGSTNGSFINEERLIPGRKTEFTSFFPVRLGDNVLITLISDDEGESRIDIPASFKERTSPNIQRDEAPDRTTVIPLKELSKAKTGKLVQNRDQKRAAAKKQITKPIAKPKPKKEINIVPYLAVAILIGAGVANFYMIDEEKPESTEPVTVQEIGKGPETLEPEKPKSNLLVPEDDLVAKDAYATLQNDFKCTTDDEANLCNFFPHAKGGNFGVVQVGLTLHVIADGTIYFEKAAKQMGQSNATTPQLKETYQQNLLDVAALMYLEDVSKQYIRSQTPPAPKVEEAPAAVTDLVPPQGVPGEAPVAEPLPVEPPPAVAAPQEERIHYNPDSFKDMRFSIALMKKNDDGTLVVGRMISIRPDVIPMLKDLRFDEVYGSARFQRPGAFYEVKQKYRSY